MQGAMIRVRRILRGFSLIEMVVTLVLIGIVGGTLALALSPAVRGYAGVTQRAELVDAAESALRRIARDIRIAVPNSIRVTTALGGGASGFAIELVPTADGARYCLSGDANCNSRPANGGGAANAAFNDLDVTVADSDFTVLGCFRNATFTAAALGGTTGYRLVVNNRAVSDLYGAAGSGQVITPSATTITLSVNPGTGGTPAVCGSASASAGIANAHHINIGGGGYQFMTNSSRRRVFVVDTSAAPVTYVCDTNAGTLTRYAGYGIQSVQPSDPTAAPLSTAPTSGRVAGDVSSCSATSTLGVQGSGLMTLDLSVTKSGETIRLVQQVQLDNSQ